MTPTQKVAAYLLRQGAAGAELLVFEHVGVAAGLQVPAGSVEPGEAHADAVRRELQEEAGFAGPAPSYLGSLIRFFTPGGDPLPGVTEYHCYGAWVTGLPDTWEHRVTGGGEDAGLRFRYRWVPLAPPPALAGRQEDGLALLARGGLLPGATP